MGFWSTEIYSSTSYINILLLLHKVINIQTKKKKANRRGKGCIPLPLCMSNIINKPLPGCGEHNIHGRICGKQIGKFKRLKCLFEASITARQRHLSLLNFPIGFPHILHWNKSWDKESHKYLLSHCIVWDSFKTVEEMPADKAAAIHTILMQSWMKKNEIISFIHWNIFHSCNNSEKWRHINNSFSLFWLRAVPHHQTFHSSIFHKVVWNWSATIFLSPDLETQRTLWTNQCLPTPAGQQKNTKSIIKSVSCLQSYHQSWSNKHFIFTLHRKKGKC